MASRAPITHTNPLIPLFFWDLSHKPHNFLLSEPASSSLCYIILGRTQHLLIYSSAGAGADGASSSSFSNSALFGSTLKPGGLEGSWQEGLR